MKKLPKNFILILVISILTTLLISCTNTKITYPNLTYNATGTNYDISDKYIFIDEGYVLNDSNPYDRIETDDGYDIIVHLIKKEN